MENGSFLYNLIIKTIVEILYKDAYINEIIDGVIKEYKLNGNDKSVYTKLVYGVVENKLLLEFKLKPYLIGKKVKPYFKVTLLIFVYCFENTNIASHFVCDTLVECVKKIDFQASKLINGVIRSYIRGEHPVDLNSLDFIDRISIQYSLPKELLQLILDDYGEELKIKEFECLIKNLTTPSVENTFVVNSLKVKDPESLIKDISDEFEIKSYDNFIVSKKSLINTSYFKEGLIIPMNYSSTLPPITLNPKSGSNVLDCCSAPGSKGVYLSMIMNNIGSITCLDIYEHKMDLIKYNARKYGSKIMKTLCADAMNVSFNEEFDYILVDGPCSGLGVISHKPDLKYRMNINSIKELAETNFLILSNIRKYLKKDGILVFSTCTITKEENNKMIRNFINKYKNFEILEETQILPNGDDLKKDGFYIVKLKKG